MSIMVSVLMTAYNHEKYIRDAIEGVVYQQTSFPIELIVHDDASTDDTAQIIKEYAKKYPNIVKPIFEKENIYSTGKKDIFFDILMQRASGKYIAICEGDDYWIDKHKLQKQYDFMESHPDFSMTMHNAWKLDMNTGNKILLNTFSSSGYYSLEDQVRAGLGSKFPATASYFFRREMWHTYPDELKKGLVGDYFIRLYNASKGKVYYFEEPMSVYRYMTDGSFTQKISVNSDYYCRYIRDIVRKYNALDKYLNYQFHDIYQKAIASNIIGYLASESKDSRINDSIDLSSEFISRCRKHLDEDYLEPEIAGHINFNSKVWIYGTSSLGKIYFHKLLNHDINVKGFAVTDGYTKPELFEGKKVSNLSEVLRNDSDTLFVVAVQPINADSIIEGLQKANITNYIYPLMDLED